MPSGSLGEVWKATLSGNTKEAVNLCGSRICAWWSIHISASGKLLMKRWSQQRPVGIYNRLTRFLHSSHQRNRKICGCSEDVWGDQPIHILIVPNIGYLFASVMICGVRMCKRKYACGYVAVLDPITYSRHNETREWVLCHENVWDRPGLARLFVCWWNNYPIICGGIKFRNKNVQDYVGVSNSFFLQTWMCGPSLKWIRLDRIMFKTDMCAARDKRRKGNITTGLAHNSKYKDIYRRRTPFYVWCIMALGRYVTDKKIVCYQ